MHPIQYPFTIFVVWSSFLFLLYSFHKIYSKFILPIETDSIQSGELIGNGQVVSDNIDYSKSKTLNLFTNIILLCQEKL